MNDTPELRLELLKLAVAFVGRDHNGDASDATDVAADFLTFVTTAPAVN